MSRWRTTSYILAVIAATLILFTYNSFDMLYSWFNRFWGPTAGITGFFGATVAIASAGSSAADTTWYAPKLTSINNMTDVVNGTGVYGFIFNSSVTPLDLPYGTYNWCNMPHVRAQEYVKAPDGYKLEYVEVIHRHHKRTPYASNTFPQETYSWSCDDEALFYYGAPQPENTAAAINWQVYISNSNPLVPTGFNGTCLFPQISAGGLIDSRQHGSDLFKVYHDLLNFLPGQLDPEKISYRVTNNQITSQVASQVIYGMYPFTNHASTSVLIQPLSVDSLEPKYECSSADKMYSSYGVGSNSSKWTAHLSESRRLFKKLDSVSGISASDASWHDWFDHYFDNLSARLCHDKPLPCNLSNPELCITMDDAEAVFRRGLYEYSFIYRDEKQSLQASTASYGIWIAELADNLRKIMKGSSDKTIWRHNFAHDGSMARLLSILQINVMVWPGMGSELVFELYSKDGAWFVRVLWGGKVFRSSHPCLGNLDLVTAETLIAYFDSLVGQGAIKVPLLCKHAQ